MHLARIFVTFLFIAEALKWYLTGVYGRSVAQVLYVGSLGILELWILIRIMIMRRFGLESSTQEDSSRERYVFPKRKLQKLVFAVYLVLVSISLLRSINVIETVTVLTVAGRIVTLLLVVVGWVLVLQSANNQEKMFDVWDWITNGLGIYILVNILGWMLGVSNSYVDQLKFVASKTIFGFSSARVEFPFSASHQVVAHEAGILIALSLYQLFLRGKKRKVHYYVFVVAGLFVAIAADVRTPILVIAMLSVFFGMWRVTQFYSAKMIVLAVLLVPIVVNYVNLEGIVPKLEGISMFTRRNDVNELLTLNNRAMIWKTVFREFSEFRLSHIGGFGAHGQVRAGLSRIYAVYWPNPDAITLHNSYLQALVELGYIGLLTMVMLLANTYDMLRNTYMRDGRRKLRPVYPATVAMLYLTVASGFEVIIYFNQSISYALFLLVCLQVVMVKDDLVLPSSTSEYTTATKEVL